MNQRPREEARFFTFFTCLLLNLGLTFGSIFCPITAFHLPVEEGVLAAVLALVCLLSALLYRYRRAGLWMLGLWVLALAGVLLLAWEDLEQGTRYVYTRLTSIYHIAYDYLQLPAWRPRGPGDATCLFALWGGALASVNAWVIRAAAECRPCLAAGCAAFGPVSGGGGYAAGSLVPDSLPGQRLPADFDPVQPGPQSPGGQSADAGAGPAGGGRPGGDLPGHPAGYLHPHPECR